LASGCVDHVNRGVTLSTPVTVSALKVSVGSVCALATTVTPISIAHAMTANASARPAHFSGDSRYMQKLQVFTTEEKPAVLGRQRAAAPRKAAGRGCRQRRTKGPRVFKLCERKSPLWSAGEVVPPSSA